MIMKHEWTPDRVEELKRLWSLGYTGSQIMRLMDIPTRNIIMGKIHRLGIQRKSQVLQPVPLDKLTSGQCRWPFGDGPFVFCGVRVQFGRSYCEEHHAMAWKNPV